MNEPCVKFLKWSFLSFLYDNIIMIKRLFKEFFIIKKIDQSL